MAPPRLTAAVLRATCAWAWAVLISSRLTIPLAGAEPTPAASVGTTDFTGQIQPLLEHRCTECHGPTKAKGGLRVDSIAAIQKGGDSGPAIVPGNAKASLLIKLVTGGDPDRLMPAKGDRLTEAEVAVLTAWIDQGAKVPENAAAATPAKRHWAYVPPVRTEPPAVRAKHWPRNAIDHFILARLEREHLPAAPEADRRTLIRRVSLDLTGLPPTPAETEAFIRDRRPDAYERVVDRLLASPRYGERWARPWLDLARYADTNGYEKDDRRSNWPYRDWVIHGLNRDLPFDEFTIEQLAGDLLPDATTEQKIATGFHRNTMINTEGGTDDEEFRTAAVIDRVNTTATVWLGTTLGCAQCHNHKYDPFSQREYYQIFAFFNQTRDGGKALDPTLDVPTPEQAAQRAELRPKIEPLEKLLETQTPELDAAQIQWEEQLETKRRTIADGWTLVTPDRATAQDGVVLEPQPDQSLFARVEKLPLTNTYELVVHAWPTNLTAIRLEALTDERLPHHSSGWSPEGEFVLTDFSVELVPLVTIVPPAPADTNAKPFKVEFEKAYADFAEDRFDAGKAIDGDALTGWAIGADEEKNRTNRYAVFLLKNPLTNPPPGELVVRLKQESMRPRNLLGRFRISFSTVPAETLRAWAELPAAIRTTLTHTAAQRTDEEKKELAKHHRGLTPLLAQPRHELEELRKLEPKDVPTTLVLQTVDKPRSTHVFKRGSFLNPDVEVEPATPAALPGLPPDQPRDRLGLARWLVSPQNPLVGRVTMNRIWATYFGRGLVETSEEFGAQGEPPSHPELLDWLATEFVRQHWSLKAMHRLIVTSATYRQSARSSVPALARDPFNRLLSHAPRVRMEAEMLRDYTLAVSGLLREEIGGPSVFPYQPDGVWAMPYSDDKWVANTNGQQFRRGLYTFARRSSPYAAFANFDAPSREVCTERRPRTNTPIQALTTLNDPAFVVAAGGLARRILAEGGPTDSARVAFAFRTAVGRTPTSTERRALLSLFHRAVARFSQEPAAAVKLLDSVGLPAKPNSLRTPEAKPAQPPAAVSDWAAWVTVANTIFNLDEALTKG